MPMALGLGESAEQNAQLQLFACPAAGTDVELRSRLENLSLMITTNDRLASWI